MRLLATALTFTAMLIAPNRSLFADPGDGETPGGSCTASTDCYKQVYNSTTLKWESVKYGSVSCSTTSGTCTSGSNYVECGGQRSICTGN